MATVRPHVMSCIDPDSHRKGEIQKYPVLLPEKIKSHKEYSVKVKTTGVNVSDADVIISIGRGIGSPQNINMIYELASELGAAVGASRAIVDAGWIDFRHQVGQTGKTVNPKLYIACGISGAVQHIAGMSSSDLIVAINNDSEAPIFNIAKYGVVGDIMEVLPAFIKEFKKRKDILCK